MEDDLASSSPRLGLSALRPNLGSAFARIRLESELTASSEQGGHGGTATGVEQSAKEFLRTPLTTADADLEVEVWRAGAARVA